MAESNAPIDLESDTPPADDGYIPYFTPEQGGGSSHGGGSESGSIPRASTPTSYPRSSTPLVTSPPANAGVAKKGKKRSRFDESAIETLYTFCKASVEHMGDMVRVMGYAKELSALRKLVPDEVEKLELSEEEKFRLVAIISKAEERVDTFFGTREEKKLRWAQMVLQGKVYPLNE